MKNENEKLDNLFQKLEQQWDIQEIENNHEDRFLAKLKTKKQSNKYFLPIEVKEIRDFNFQIKMIGNNINQISTKLNSNKTLNNIDISILKNSIDELNIRMKETKDEIENILNFANKRF